VWGLGEEEMGASVPGADWRRGWEDIVDGVDVSSLLLQTVSWSRLARFVGSLLRSLWLSGRSRKGRPMHVIDCIKYLKRY